MIKTPKIDILLATYNAENFLSEQINSIINQDYKNWNLIISDDGSTDRTIKIIKEYIKKYPDKISLLDFTKNRGAKDNFNFLLQSSISDYICFADHDDVWFNDKLSISIKNIQLIENKNNTKIPALVFTDKTVTDQTLNILQLSHTGAERFNTLDIKLNTLLVQNVASGCTIMINKELKNKVGSIPDNAVMHDHYIMLIAKIFGEIFYIDKPTMFYRQHSQNEIGASSYNFNYIFNKLRTGRKKIKMDFMKRINQSEYIIKNYHDIPDKKLHILKLFNKLATANFFQFRYILIKGGYFKTGFLRKLGMMILL